MISSFSMSGVFQSLRLAVLVDPRFVARRTLAFPLLSGWFMSFE